MVKDQEIFFLCRYLLILNTSYIFNKEKIKMEYIIGLAVIAVIVYLVARMSKSTVELSKVELVEQAPVLEEKVAEPAPTPVVVEAPAKKTRKPRAVKVEQAPVKAPAKKTAAKAPAKVAVKASKAPAKKTAAKAKSKKA